MPPEPVDIARVLKNRLETIGIESDFIPGLLNDIYNSFYHEPNISRDKINNKLHSLGWTDVELDYHTFSLAEANLHGYAKTIHPGKPMHHPKKKPVKELS